MTNVPPEPRAVGLFTYSVPAFNVNNLEQMRAIMEAAAETRSPVIVQASAGARKYAGANFLRHLLLASCRVHLSIQSPDKENSLFIGVAST